MELDGKNYHRPEDLAEAMLYSRGIDTKLNLEILASAPYANQLTPDRFEIAKNKLADANDILPDVRTLLSSAFYSVIARGEETKPIDETILKSKDPQANTYKTLQLLDFLLKQQEDPIVSLVFVDKNIFRLAVLEEGVSLTKKLHRKTEDPELKKMVLSFTVYYSALQALMLGMQTNSILLLHDRENFMNTDSDMIGMAVNMISPEGHEKTKVRMLFNGYTILDEKKSEGGTSYLVIKTNTPDEDIT